MLGLIDDLNDLPATLGPDAGSEHPYVPHALAAITRTWTEPGSTSQRVQPERAWPGPALPGEPMGRLPLRCVTVTDADVATVMDAAETATALTLWNSGASRWTVILRPLLPDERSCADVV